MSSTLEYYWDLADLKPEKRLKAANQLITTLLKFQKEFESQKASKQNNSTIPNEARKEADLELLCAADVCYALKRLIKGLTSSRDAARQGFSIVLTELLAQIPVITAEIVISIIGKVSEIKSAMAGQEQKDMWFGRLFTFLSLADSGALSRKSTTEDDFIKIIDQLYAMSNNKQWLSQAAFNTISRVVKAAPSDLLVSFLIPYLMENIIGGDNIDSPDKLKLILELIKICPEYNWSSALKSWDSGAIYSSKNIKNLARVLLENSKDSSDNFLAHHPHVHSVWDVILDDYFPLSSQPKSPAFNVPPGSTTLTFMDIWDPIVDKGYFAQNSTVTRKFWGFQLATNAIMNVSIDVVPMLLTKNMFSTLLNQLNIKTSNMRGASNSLLKSITSRAESDKTVSLALIQKLTGANVDVNFDNITKSTTISSLMNNLTSESLIGYINHLKSLVLKPKTTIDSDSSADPSLSSQSKMSQDLIRNNRIWAIDQIIRVLNNPKLPRNKELFNNAINFFVSNSLFTPNLDNISDDSTVPTPPFGKDLNKVFGDRLLSLFSIISKLPIGFENIDEYKVGDKEVRILGQTSDGEFWISLILKEISKLEDSTLSKSKAKSQSSILYPHSKSDLKKRKDIIQKISQLLNPKITRNVSSEDTKEYIKKSKTIGELLCLLYLKTIVIESNISQHWETEQSDVQLEPSSEIQDLVELIKAVDELIVCSDHIFKKSKATKSQSSDDDSHAPEEVLLDLLVSLLTQKSSILRQPINNVFSVISSDISETGINILFDTIKSSNQDKDGFEDDLDDDSEDEVEMEVDNTNKNDSENESSSDNDSEQPTAKKPTPNASSNSNTDGFLEVDSLLETKLKEALGNHLENSDIDDDNSSDEELLDDDQMEEFDEKLSAIFKIKNQIKKDKAESEQNVINFKLRVLDLYEIFVKKQSPSTNILVFKVISQLVPLAHKLSTSKKNANLYAKVKTCLMTIRKADSFASSLDDEIYVSSLVDYATSSLSLVLKTAKKSNDKAELDVYTSVAAYISRVLVLLGSATSQSANSKLVEQSQKCTTHLIEVYTDAAKDFFERKNSKLQFSFFSPLVTQFKTEPLDFLPFKVAEIIAPYTDPSAAVNGFRLAEAFSYYSELVRSNKPKFESIISSSNENSSESINIGVWLSTITNSIIKCINVYNKTEPLAGTEGNKETGSKPVDKTLVTRQKLVAILKSYQIVLNSIKRAIPPNSTMLEYSMNTDSQQVGEFTFKHVFAAIESLLEQKKPKDNLYPLLTSIIINLKRTNSLPANNNNNNNSNSASKKRKLKQNGSASKSKKAKHLKKKID
ncbi:DNA polymerase V [Smittium culicis]|uniref:DNA polymerase V n=1 Tax=Smittium culicis TaxID=133412 RepID=A0A1R1YCN4_9FUNG|nr:DNA polymerase V [Smittium culicis]